MRGRGDFDVAQHGADINRLAVIAAVIFAELLHAENIMQLVAPKCNEGGRRENAKNFYPSIRPRKPPSLLCTAALLLLHLFHQAVVFGHDVVTVFHLVVKLFHEVVALRNQIGDGLVLFADVGVSIF